MRRVDTFARVGGDELTVIPEKLDHPHEGESVCVKLVKALEAPIHVQNHECYVTTSTGVTFYPRDDLGANDLPRSSDAVMYRAEEEGRNKCNVFTADLNAPDPAHETRTGVAPGH